jgi:calcium-dependent protein kinase
MVEAIAFCHKHQIIHRDVKLENIMLNSADDDTSVKLIDFGLAKPLTPACAQMMTMEIGHPFWLNILY